MGSLITLNTLSPAIFPASFVACLCESLKYAGTVITAFCNANVAGLKECYLQLQQLMTLLTKHVSFATDKWPKTVKHTMPLQHTFFTPADHTSLRVHLFVSNSVARPNLAI